MQVQESSFTGSYGGREVRGGVTVDDKETITVEQKFTPMQEHGSDTIVHLSRHGSGAHMSLWTDDAHLTLWLTDGMVKGLRDALVAMAADIESEEDDGTVDPLEDAVDGRR